MQKLSVFIFLVDRKHFSIYLDCLKYQTPENVENDFQEI